MGVNTYSQLRLEQRGTAIAGAFGVGGVSSSPNGTDKYSLRGTASLPHLALQWDEKINDVTYHITVDATLSADDESLSTVFSTNGVAASGVHGYRRSPPS